MPLTKKETQQLTQAIFKAKGDTVLTLLLLVAKNVSAKTFQKIYDEFSQDNLVSKALPANFFSNANAQALFVAGQEVAAQEVVELRKAQNANRVQISQLETQLEAVITRYSRRGETQR